MPEITPTTNTPTEVLRAQTRGTYDLQKVRIAYGNRICQAWYVGHGVEPGTKPSEELADQDAKLLANLQKEYKLLASAIVSLPEDRDADIPESVEGVPQLRKFQPGKLIDTKALMQMMAAYNQILTAENTSFKTLAHTLEDIPIYQTFLKQVVGCGPAMAAICITYLDVHKAEYPSQFWAYSGLDVVNGEGRSRKKAHLVDREYTNKDGEKSVRKSITFEPLLKTKLIGVLARSFYMNNQTRKKKGLPPEKYWAIYEGYRARLDNHPNWAEKTDFHKNNAARRYMIKMFLLDLWKAWRYVEGLPITPSYAEGKLGIVHHERRPRNAA